MVKCLGSMMAEDGGLCIEITHIRRVWSGRNNWKCVSGVLCDRRINLSVKGKYTRQ